MSCCCFLRPDPLFQAGYVIFWCLKHTFFGWCLVSSGRIDKKGKIIIASRNYTSIGCNLLQKGKVRWLASPLRQMLRWISPSYVDTHNAHRIKDFSIESVFFLGFWDCSRTTEKAQRKRRRPLLKSLYIGCQKFQPFMHLSTIYSTALQLRFQS